jgi:hypothetical protein
LALKSYFYTQTNFLEMKRLISLIFLLIVFVRATAVPENIVANIHVNQFGYLPEIEKVAVISNPISGYNSGTSFTPGTLYQLRNWYTDEVVFSAEITPWNNGQIHDQSGDRVWWFDFTPYSSNGSYYVHDNANNMSSGKFEIDDCVYSELLKTSLHVFLYQRCGVEKNAAYAGAQWADGICHKGLLQDTDCRLYNDAQNDNTSRDLSGGWHDAGDYNKYVNFSFDVVLDLCDAYAFNPSVWTDNFNLPESGNGQSDLLDELKNELDWLLKMQESNGAVLCMVGAPNYETASPPSADMVQRVYGPATTASTFAAGAMFARAALIYTGEYAQSLQAAAVSAWSWATDNSNVVFYNSGSIVSGEQQTDEYGTWVRQMAAAIYLADLTNDLTYHDFVESNYLNAHLLIWSYAYPFEASLQNALLHYSSLLPENNEIRIAINSAYSESMSNTNDDNLPAFNNETDAYRAFLRSDNYTWGSNTTKGRQGVMFQNMLNYPLNLIDTQNYNEAALGFLHYFCGVNPNNTCFLTNMNTYGAEYSCNSIYHAWFGDGSALWDDANISLYGPAPGYLQGGPNPSYSLDDCCNSDCGIAEANALCDASQVAPPMNQPVQKAWRDWNTGWPQNSWTVTEPGIYTQASLVRLLSEYVTLNCMNTTEDLGEVTTNLYVMVFPNPCQNELIVSATMFGTKEVTLEVLDATGRVVLSTETFAHKNKVLHSIDIAALTDGAYFLRLTSHGLNKTTQFIKLNQN